MTETLVWFGTMGCLACALHCLARVLTPTLSAAYRIIAGLAIFGWMWAFFNFAALL